MTLDAHLIALAGMTGAVLWDRVVADYRQGYSSTGAPLAVKDMVITGIAGSEFGAPGFIAAYDARTGSLRWRFDTIPKPGEKGNDTWAGKSWRTGGVATWMPGSYDPDLDLIFWGTANPAPDYDTSSRAGDNLYSNSVVALHADSGRLAWYFQYTPADDHDWDSVQTPVLADVVDGAQTRRLLLAANRNGFFYALDRTDGKFLRATPYVRQNWAERIEANGRPVRRAAASPSARGALVYPGTSGGTNWWPPTFSPLAQLFIVPALERPGFFFKTKLGEVRQGANIVAGVSAGTSASHFTAVRALDPRTGALRWEYTSASGHGSAELCGLLSTAGGLVFTNHKSKLVGLDIDTGREMWSFEAGGRINSSPATYLAGQEQIIAFAAGDDVIGVALPPRRAASDAP
jgi:alcohol dehydrogenase (cytochrome c)